MAKTYSRLDERLVDFIERQHVFFVATAPLKEDGIVNLSPKGHDTLRVLDDRTVAGREGLVDYREHDNRRSLEGLPALETTAGAD